MRDRCVNPAAGHRIPRICPDERGKKKRKLVKRRKKKKKLSVRVGDVSGAAWDVATVQCTAHNQLRGDQNRTWTTRITGVNVAS